MDDIRALRDEARRFMRTEGLRILKDMAKNSKSQYLRLRALAMLKTLAKIIPPPKRQKWKPRIISKGKP